MTNADQIVVGVLVLVVATPLGFLIDKVNDLKEEVNKLKLTVKKLEGILLTQRGDNSRDKSCP